MLVLVLPSYIFYTKRATKPKSIKSLRCRMVITQFLTVLMRKHAVYSFPELYNAFLIGVMNL